MRLYNNENAKPYIFYSNKSNHVSSNQQYYRVNYLQEILEEQSQINLTLKKSVEHVNLSIHRTKDSHDDKFQNLSNKLQEQAKYAEALHEYVRKQEETNSLIMTRLEQLEKRNEALLEKLEAESLLTQAILDQQSTHDAALNKLTANLEEKDALLSHMEKQDEVFTEFASKLELQEVFHNTVMERLDQQEGLIKKISGELDHLRSIVYERTAHLVEKMEANFARIAKPIQRFFIHTEVKEKDKVE